MTVTEAVGPDKITVAPAKGALQVYTATEMHTVGNSTYYYPHSAYLVYDSAGRQVKYVSNHVGTMDEKPSIVFIAPGTYMVMAEAEGYGRVRIPVMIQAGRTTVVHLEMDWKPRNANAAELVRLPDGQPIGWRDASAAAEKPQQP